MDGYSTQEMTGALGPSFAHGRKAFECEYGDEREVLVRLQSWVIERSTWNNHELFDEWLRLKSLN